MVYGNAGLLGVPWETIIKTYRCELKRTTFNRLEDYAEHFLNFLASQEHFFPKDLQAGWIEGNIRGYFTLIRDDLLEKVKARFKEPGELDEIATLQLFQDTVGSHYKQLRQKPLVNGMTTAIESTFKRIHRSRLEKLRLEVFQKIKPSRIVAAQLASIATYIHTREIFSESQSGLVICGFGNDDVYPVVVTHIIDGLLDDKLKYKLSKEKTHRITHGNDCSIIPFAQDDMVASFMEGMNPSLMKFIDRYLRQLFSRLPELISDDELTGEQEKKRATREKLSGDATKLLNSFLQELKGHKRAEHVDPILGMVQVLPKDELAAMAEALVSLTAFKRRMTDELETVGGPIDVAVISKGDGLVWVKRKHYFPAELNQHFFANYFRGVVDGDC